MLTQICSKCKETKSLATEYDKNPAYAIGYYRQCKDCRKKHPSQTPVKLLERVYRTRMRNRQYLWDFYVNHPCTDCGESDPRVLELDHCRGEKKIAGVSELVHNTRSLAAIQKEIEKCDVVCANCHRIRTCNSQGWYLGIQIAELAEV